jgi:hypothetical protein
VRSERGLAGLLWALLVAGCAGDVGAPAAGDAGETVQPAATLVEPEVPLFAGVEQLETLRPSRCQDLSGKAPEFAWQRPGGQPGTGQDRVFAAVFSAPPVVIGQSVSNTDEGVWWWSTGLSRTTGQGRDGSVRWGEGRGFSNGQPADVPAPAPAPGAWHYFAVWAWDAGRRLVLAGEVRAFCPGGGCDCEALAQDLSVRDRFCRLLPAPPPGDAPGCVVPPVPPP